MSEHIAAAPDAASATSRRDGWTAELRAMFELAWPLVIAQLAQNALHTTDVILLGWLGSNYLAAGTLGTTFMMPFLVGGVGVVGAVAPLVAQARGSPLGMSWNRPAPGAPPLRCSECSLW